MTTSEIKRINRDKLPQKLYKYCMSEHLQTFSETGELRIGTLFNFRRTEEHSGDCGDHEEGIKSIYENIGVAKGSDLSDFARRSIKARNDALFIGCRVERITKSRDYYIFSVSRSFSWDIAQRIEPKYDACIVIDGPLGFLGAIVTCMGNKIKNQWYLMACHYSDRSVEYTKKNDIHPATLKDPKYAYQEEYRLIMVPSISQAIIPVMITCPSAIKFCSFEFK